MAYSGPAHASFFLYFFFFAFLCPATLKRSICNSAVWASRSAIGDLRPCLVRVAFSSPIDRHLVVQLRVSEFAV
ncbi:hypothetical protein P168DRAFT_287149 [Aspergillus campestris IBT 28561]|uniref:Uncharacterized protein n=1 Tax=Aspergillus campestris (strain IBT 28561) TaxID=1392248 RepID=A0A2I1DGT0_ASPC2|nr:uncharacterized protein P168DRAFT_287149 [Aspergillus campestris IBT 28561]PKY09079.1 hypothetical protein P168DRAFT_287149 [Aspergillus campestris IBT 28561]